MFCKKLTWAVEYFELASLIKFELRSIKNELQSRLVYSLISIPFHPVKRRILSVNMKTVLFLSTFLHFFSYIGSLRTHHFFQIIAFLLTSEVFILNPRLIYIMMMFSRFPLLRLFFICDSSSQHCVTSRGTSIFFSTFAMKITFVSVYSIPTICEFSRL